MTVTIATEVRPGKPRNEDLAFFLDGFAAVLDGASLPYPAPCGHDSAWYVRVLAKHLLSVAQEVAQETRQPCLPEVLSEGIYRSQAEHAVQCRRPEEPLSGAATVALARQRDDVLDYLVLCDSAVLIDDGDDHAPRLVTDERIAALPLRSGARIRELLLEGRGYGDEYEKLQREQARELLGYRNEAGGYWVAAADPAAAEEALTGTVTRCDVALLTDGVTRAVTSLSVYAGWRELWAGLLDAGPQSVISRVRQAEHDDPDGVKCPRGSPHDDATALVWQR